jgi:hypothetical protein
VSSEIGAPRPALETRSDGDRAKVPRLQLSAAPWSGSGAGARLVLPGGSYVLDFPCIHPFRDGNGRMAWLLALLLLHQGGDGAGRYMSIGKMIETTRESH